MQTNMRLPHFDSSVPKLVGFDFEMSIYNEE